MKIFFLILLNFLFLFTKAQDKVVKYYDSDWALIAKEKAIYYAEFVKEDTAYTCHSYWIGSDILLARSTFADTSFAKAIGLQLRYYKNGNVQDSTLYDDRGQISYTFHYHENKQLAIRYIVADEKKESVTEAYDESGNTLKNYVYLKEAEFKGGDKAWSAYLHNNVTKDFRNNSEAEAAGITSHNKEVTVTVQINFIIDENGNVVEPKVLKSSEVSYVDKDALNVIASSPQWKNGIYLNKPVKTIGCSLLLIF